MLFLNCSILEMVANSLSPEKLDVHLLEGLMGNIIMCEIMLNLGQWFRRRCKYVSILALVAI